VAKALDMVVANDVSDPVVGFASDTNRVSLVTADEVEEIPLMHKTQLARILWDRIAARLPVDHQKETE
jgi:phosphopantothenoylcysteine decarboxylase/phosphopantothenate--cysteine ligase